MYIPFKSLALAATLSIAALPAFACLSNNCIAPLVLPSASDSDTNPYEFSSAEPTFAVLQSVYNFPSLSHVGALLPQLGNIQLSAEQIRVGSCGRLARTRRLPDIDVQE